MFKNIKSLNLTQN